MALPTGPVSRTHLAASPGRVKKGGDLDDPRSMAASVRADSVVNAPRRPPLATSPATVAPARRRTAVLLTWWPLRMCA
ncbi:hypothetical protein ACFQ61_06375 [Streptomyces sp. NPDC056500]|uniref:hypothetical protein n=1 Tax=Streptomyces sp. NPDC056500 TaxID=3345840 RepID=UPI003678A5FB